MVKSFRGRSLASSVRSSQDDSAPALDPSSNDSYAKVTESRGKGQFLVCLPDNSTTSSLLVYMPPKFRNALWIRRGSFVIVRRYEEDKGELVHVLSPEQIKEIKRDGKWPQEFTNDFAFEYDSEDSEESEDIEESDSEESDYISESE